jgi:hypothetical protein
VGPIKELLLSPGGLESVRAVWMTAQPVWPGTANAVLSSAVPGGAVPLENVQLDRRFEAAGVYLVRAEIPLPDLAKLELLALELRGLALMGPDDTLLSQMGVWPAPRAPDGPRRATITWLIGVQD